MSVRLLAIPAAVLAVGGLATGAALLPRTTAAPAVPSTVASASPAASFAGMSAAPAATASARPAASSSRSPLSTPAADAAVDAYTAATDSLSGDATPDLAALEEVVSGSALQEVQAEQLELKANGESLRGSARVTAVRLLKHGVESGTPTARISACIDSGHVQRVDADGRPVSTTTVGAQRALNLYDLRQEHGVWRIVRHTFPADTAC